MLKNKYIFLTGLILTFSCKNNVSKNKEKISCNVLFENIRNIDVSNIRLSKNISDNYKQEILENKECFEDTENINTYGLESISLLLLKLNLFQLKNSHLSFDLLDYSDSTTMLILNLFFKNYSIDTTNFFTGHLVGQGFYTHQAFNYITKDTNLTKVKEIDSLLNETLKIEKEIEDYTE